MSSIKQQRLRAATSSLVKKLKVPHKSLLYLVLLLLLLPAIRPLLTSDFTCGFDNTFHLWRAVQVDALWSQGVFYSRWAPDMAQGFGFPLFVFTSPGPSMIAALLHRGGLLFPVAINFTFVIGIMIGAFCMFNLADDLFGPSAGLVSAVAYAYAPFQAYDVFNRGSLWESFAWAFPPLVLWGINRWAVDKQQAGLVWGVTGLALMVMSHHLFAFLFGPLFAIWVLALAIHQHDWHVLWRGVLLGFLGMGLTAFFWLPPLVERQFVQTDRLIGTWVFDFRYNFISLKHLLASPRIADHLLINDWSEKALGLGPVILSLFSFVGYRKVNKRRKWTIVVLFIMAVLSAIMTLPISRFVWDNIDLLRYVQFPWRFLGPGAFCIALLCGAASAALTRVFALSINQPWIIFVMSSLLIFANLGWFYPIHCEVQEDISIPAMLEWEQLTDTLGTTAKGEYLPVWVKRFPSASSIQNVYKSDGVVNRIDLATLPSGSTIVDSSFSAIRDFVNLKAADAFRIRWLRFYYPGWHVKIDGRSVPVNPEPETGLLLFDVPTGEHTIEVRFTETPLRMVSDCISIITLIAFVTIIYFNPSQTFVEKTISINRFWLYFIFVIGLLSILFLYGDREWSLWRNSQFQEDAALRGVDYPLHINFDNKAVLLGVDNLPTSLYGDETTEVTLYWRALNPGDADWQVGFTLVGPEGKVVRNVGLRPSRWARTPPPLAEWSRDKYARMDFVLDIPAGLPPGKYDMRLKLFDRKSLVPASVLGDNGNPQGPELILGNVEVRRPRTPFSLNSLNLPEDAQPILCGPLRLWSMQADREVAIAGDIVVIQWVWEAAVQPGEDIRIPLNLIDAMGNEQWVWAYPIIAGWWSTDKWLEGDRWVGNIGLRIPGSVESGTYTISTEYSACDAQESLPIDIIAPERIWTMPTDYSPVDEVFGARITLEGYLLEERKVQPGKVLELSLAWQTLVEMEFSYRIFVHVTGEDGTILVQNDGIPALWTRPTTGWAVNEIIIDNRSLTIPSDAEPGTYKLTTGIYHEDGTRLTLPDDGDRFELGTIVVE